MLLPGEIKEDILKRFNLEITSCSCTSFSNLVNYKKSRFFDNWHFDQYRIFSAHSDSPRRESLKENAQRVTRDCPLLARWSLGSRENRHENPFFRLSWKGPRVPCDFRDTRSRRSGTSRGGGVCAWRNPTVSSAITIRYMSTWRPTSPRAHFSVFTALFEETVSSLCSPLLWPAANPRSNNDVQTYVFIIAIVLWQRENAAESRRGDEIPFDLPYKSESILSSEARPECVTHVFLATSSKHMFDDNCDE